METEFGNSAKITSNVETKKYFLTKNTLIFIDSSNRFQKKCGQGIFKKNNERNPGRTSFH